MRQLSSGVGEWRGNITAGKDARVTLAAGSFVTYGNLLAGANTLSISNVNTFTMSAGQFLGDKTTGDGALHKSGSGGMFLRGATLTGSVVVAQGQLRLAESLAVPNGALRLQDRTALTSSDSTERTVAKPVHV